VTPTTSTTPTTTPATTTTPPAQTVTPPTIALKPGDKGAQVRLLQRELQSLGFSTGKVDGQYGAATEAAVKKFQAARNLTDDGVVGPATLAALAKAARGG
jgi:peptidoglycan hydrolase-like protein with peptidoglycan-binding domain